MFIFLPEVPLLCAASAVSSDPFSFGAPAISGILSKATILVLKALLLDLLKRLASSGSVSFTGAIQSAFIPDAEAILTVSLKAARLPHPKSRAFRERSCGIESSGIKTRLVFAAVYEIAISLLSRQLFVEISIKIWR